MTLSAINSLTIHELPVAGMFGEGDRRGRMVTLVSKPNSNTIAVESQAVRIREVLIDLSAMLSDWFRDSSDLGELDRTSIEFNEAWFGINYEWVSDQGWAEAYVSHKYWSNQKIDAYIGMLLALAPLYGWKVIDQRPNRVARAYDTWQGKAKEKNGNPGGQQ